jgi:hypothetical protein
MNYIYWKVINRATAGIVYTSPRMRDTPENREVGRRLRARYLTRDGYSVRRITGVWDDVPHTIVTVNHVRRPSVAEMLRRMIGV